MLAQGRGKPSGDSRVREWSLTRPSRAAETRGGEGVGARARERVRVQIPVRDEGRGRDESCALGRGERRSSLGPSLADDEELASVAPFPPPPLSSPSTPLPLSVTALQVSPWSRPQSTCVHTPPVPSGCGRAPGRDAALSLVSPLLPGDYGTRAGSTARSGRCRVGAGARGRQAPARARAGTCTGPRWRSSRPGWSRSVGDRQAIRGQSRQQRHADISLDCPHPPGPTDPPSPRPLSPPTPLTSPPHTRTTPHHTPQVLRYTALFSGVVYGVVHRKTLQEQFDKHAADKEVQLRQHWLEEAKKAWANKQKNDSGRESPPLAFGLGLSCLVAVSCRGGAVWRAGIQPVANSPRRVLSLPRALTPHSAPFIDSHHRPGGARLRPRGFVEGLREVSEAKTPARRCREAGTGMRVVDLLCFLLLSLFLSLCRSWREQRATGADAGERAGNRETRHRTENGKSADGPGADSRDEDLHVASEPFSVSGEGGDETSTGVRTFLRSSHSKTSPVTGSTSLPSGCCDARSAKPCRRSELLPGQQATPSTRNERASER